ncbi:FkbM family methyltransferase [Candidatus Poribacteria bacterium]|jgi:FkbM family methyltransferase|nr:FkbM family methyltransferase [Candidatus Poribacteria bacterium]MBT5536530.1 FkbM family methyltransferase [Candidatus Poribacteria bacterium]MBT5713826.1 FkbM family methyltransferase [Candidatus Poribacteria bacterium]MBT7101596.1 FkbM family methyltransferase [Candidatus Poribacteria bacterium]MBT7809668.1 FkbM family methyltransferase [Candidatus Poribacteria bacterium]
MATQGQPANRWTDALLQLFDEVTKGKTLPEGSHYPFPRYPQVSLSTPYGFNLLGSANNAAILPHLFHTDDLPYEPLITFLSLMMSRTGGAYLDIGANIGYFSLLAAFSAAQPLDIHAFEPSAANFRFLRENIRRNGLEGQIHPYAIGLGDTDSTADLSAYGTGSSFVRGWDGGVGDEQGMESVIVKPLDRLFRRGELPYPTVVKIDVEGFELPVMRGGAGVLSHENVAAVICEISHGPHPGGYNSAAAETVALLEEYGFTCLGMKGSAPASADSENAAMAPASEFSPEDTDKWPGAWLCLRPTCEMHDLILSAVPLFEVFLQLYPMPAASLRQAIADLV